MNLNYSPPRITFIGILVTYFFDPATDLASADILCESVEEPATLFAKLSVFVAGKTRAHKASTSSAVGSAYAILTNLKE